MIRVRGRVGGLHSCLLSKYFFLYRKKYLYLYDSSTRSVREGTFYCMIIFTPPLRNIVAIFFSRVRRDRVIRLARKCFYICILHGLETNFWEFIDVLSRLLFASKIFLVVFVKVNQLI